MKDYRRVPLMERGPLWKELRNFVLILFNVRAILDELKRFLLPVITKMKMTDSY